jgi:hypothetical protein
MREADSRGHLCIIFVVGNRVCFAQECAKGVRTMLNTRKSVSFLVSVIILALQVTALGAGPLVHRDQKRSKGVRVLAPVNLAILIQDDLVSHVSNELGITRDFIQSLPEGSEVMVGYIRTGTLQVRQPFTSDLGKAARSLRILVSSTSASPYNPYVEVREALKKFNSRNKNPNVLLLISDGLDASRGLDPGTVLNSIDMDRAIREAKERDVSIFSFYAPSVGLTGRNHLAASWGQSSLSRISHETGGKAFFQGTTDFVTFNPYFERLARALNQLESIE